MCEYLLQIDLISKSNELSFNFKYSDMSKLTLLHDKVCLTKNLGRVKPKLTSKTESATI